MYKVKGQDQKEYGPVDAALLRLWIAEGRVDNRTLAQVEGSAEWRPILTFPEFAAPATSPAPSTPPAISVQPPADSTISTIIPYRNAPALVSYYLGVFSLIPCVGFILGIAAIILGVIGLNVAGKSPQNKGKVHSWIGIALGSLVVLAHVVLFIVFLGFAARHG